LGSYERLLQRRERIGVAAQLDQRRAAQRVGERPRAEPLRRGIGEGERVGEPVVASQQLEVLGPAVLEVRMLGQDRAVRRVGVSPAALTHQPPRPRHPPLGGCVREEIVGRRVPHGLESTAGGRAG
jgi:hypothetical protein